MDIVWLELSACQLSGMRAIFIERFGGGFKGFYAFKRDGDFAP